MKLSVCLTVHNRIPEVSRAVSDSLLLQGNRPDEVIVILDRPEAEAKRGAVEAYSRLNDFGITTRLVLVEGPKIWGCPSKAWNRAFAEATGDVLYCISSETVQASGSMDKIRHLLTTRLRVIFAKVMCSCRPQGHAVEANGLPSGNTMSSAAAPRAVGYVWAAHRSLILSTGGYNSAFDQGIGHEDVDFFLRLWDLGADFEFNDGASGLHVCHDQPTFKQQDSGLKKAEHNIRVFLSRYGTLDPWARRPRKITSSPGVTTWEHEANEA